MRTRNRAEIGFVFGFACIITACSRAPAPTTNAWNEIKIDDADADQIARAVDARDAFASRLMTKLTSTIAEGGAGNAVDICNVEAPRIAQQINDEFHVRIGRTSHKLRNPENGPPLWMSSIVAQQRADPSAFVALDGTLGATYPIRVAAPCLLCHGDPDAIIPEARTQIAAHYPDDRAVGFEAGDLRGWFWIEVPKD